MVSAYCGDRNAVRAKDRVPPAPRVKVQAYGQRPRWTNAQSGTPFLSRPTKLKTSAATKRSLGRAKREGGWPMHDPDMNSLMKAASERQLAVIALQKKYESSESVPTEQLV